MADSNSIEDVYKWNLEHIVRPDDWEKLLKTTSKKIPKMQEYKGKLGDKKSFLEFMQESQKLEDDIMRVYAYAKMKHDEDTRDSNNTSMASKAERLYVEYSSIISFVLPEITGFADSKLDDFINDEKLTEYDYMLKKIKQMKKHVLSESEEKMLAEFGDVSGGFSDVFEMLDNADLNLPEVSVEGKVEKLTHAKYSLFMQSGSRQTRKEVFEKYYSAYKKLIHALAQTYYYNVKKDWLFAKTRGYKSCLEMALDNEDVSIDIYENLLESVDKNLECMHDYTAYKKQKLGVDKFYMYDMYVPIIEGKNISLPYEDAYKLVIDGLGVLGDDYVELLKTAYHDGWIDVYEREGKRSGAYSFGVRTTHPFVLLNYEKTTHDVFTIAHELGHAMHSHYSNITQPPAKADYKIFVAEVASTVNEMLLIRHIISTTKDIELKKYLLYYLLEMFRTTVFRQTQFAEFEYKTHEMMEQGEPLTHDNLSDLYLQLNHKYYGSTIEQDDCIKYEWARIPHFYRSFYVYKYATGMISAVTLADGMLSGDKQCIDKYKQFLSSGGSLSPVELLQKAGVDLTKKQPYDSAMKVFANTLKELKKLS